MRYRRVPREGEAGPRKGRVRAGSAQAASLARAAQKSTCRSNVPPSLLPPIANTFLSTGQRLPNLACQDRRRNQVVQEGLRQSRHYCCSSLPLIHPPALQHKSGLNRCPASHLKTTAGKTRGRQSRALPVLGSQEQRLGDKQVHIALGHRSWLGCQWFGGRGWKILVIYPLKWKGTASSSSQVLHPNDKNISFGSS